MLNSYMIKIICLLILTLAAACQEEHTTIVENRNKSAISKSKQMDQKITSTYGEVKKGQGLYQALKSVSIENSDALEVINALRDEVEFSKLKVGDKLVAYRNPKKELIKFTFSQNLAEEHNLVKDLVTKKWNYNFKEKETFWKQRILKGQLREGSTLQQELYRKGVNPQTVNQVINVLLCKVNFRMNARVGDKFEVLLSERYFEDQVLQSKVLYTSYSGTRAGNHKAYFYEDEEKSSTYTAHYTQDGQALIRSGLRYPLSSLHIRSGYGWRRHPVTGKKKMHRGIDLRARIGRPVHAVADGKVIESTFNKISGNKIAIKHRDGSTSYYLHLNKRIVNKGTWVKSYQVIGSVGKTGRVTGPHLHFGFKKANGKWINPLNKRMIATPKLKGKKLIALRMQIQNIKGILAALNLRKNYVIGSNVRRNAVNPFNKKFQDNYIFNWPFLNPDKNNS